MADRNEILQNLFAGVGAEAQIDPRIDSLAKSFATMKGSEKEKYTAFVRLFPALIQEFAKQQKNPLEEYQIEDRMRLALPGGM